MELKLSHRAGQNFDRVLLENTHEIYVGLEAVRRENRRHSLHLRGLEYRLPLRSARFLHNLVNSINDPEYRARLQLAHDLGTASRPAEVITNQDDMWEARFVAEFEAADILADAITRFNLKRRDGSTFNVGLLDVFQIDPELPLFMDEQIRSELKDGDLSTQMWEAGIDAVQ